MNFSQLRSWAIKATLSVALVSALIVGGIHLNSKPTKTVQPVVVQTNTPIYRENLQTGTTSWQSAALMDAKAHAVHEEDYDDVHKDDSSGDANAAASPTWTNTAVIEGYANQVSLNKGQSVKLYVRTTQPTYTIDVYRMGYYNGTGAILLKTVTGQVGKTQTIPTPDDNGLIEANWTTPYTLATSATWTSGVYLVKLTAADGSVGYINFVLRDDAAAADIIYQVPITTYQAYNNWGGKSLYDYNSTGGRGYKVSYDRPYAQWAGAGGFFDGDYNMIRWLEKSGYNVTYVTSNDVDNNLAIYNNRKVFLSAYHDEYWSKDMRDNLTNAMNTGLDLAFFDANNMYWQIRYEPSTTGVASRVQAAYKDAALDPDALTPAETTVTWRSDPVNQPENALLGAMYESDFAWGTSFPWIVANSGNNWIYAGTGVQDGDQIAGLVGYEYDKVFNNGFTPAGTAIISNSPVVDGHGVASFANATIHTVGNSLVFDAGTIYWPWKLDDNIYESWGADLRVQKMTDNILQSMITNTNLTPLPSPSASASPTASPTPSPIPTPAPSDYTVVDEGLNAGWVDWSWNSTNNFADLTKPNTGSQDLTWQATAAWGGLLLHSNSAFDTTGYGSLSFALQASVPGQKVGVQFYGASDQGIGTMVNASNYGGDPVVGSYTVYTIPLSALAAANTTIKDFHIMDITGAAQPAMYVDSVKFVVSTPAPTATPSPTASPTPTPTPTPSPTPVPAVNIYQDSLTANWQNWSWTSTINFGNITPVYSGTSSIAFTASAAWAGLGLHSTTGVSTAGLNYLHFAALASQPGQIYSVSMDDTAGNHLTAPVMLDNYGGQPSSVNWTVYDIPLSVLNAVNKNIGEVVIQEQSGNSQPSLYIDDLSIK